MKNIFSIFTLSANSFDGKHDDEEVLVCLHQHWYTLFSKFLYAFLGALLPFILIAVFGKLIILYKLAKIIIFLCSAYYMIIWYLLAYTVTMYTMNIWIITNERIIDSTQNGFFNRTISDINLANVQDVSIKMEGAIPTFFNYGDIEVQSAGAVDHFSFDQIPNPQAIKELISEAVDQYKKSHFKNEAFEVVREVEQAKENMSHNQVPQQLEVNPIHEKFADTPISDTSDIPDNLPQ